MGGGYLCQAGLCEPTLVRTVFCYDFLGYEYAYNATHLNNPPQDLNDPHFEVLRPALTVITSLAAVGKAFGEVFRPVNRAELHGQLRSQEGCLTSNVPPMPSHLTFEQARNFMGALAKATRKPVPRSCRRHASWSARSCPTRMAAERHQDRANSIFDRRLVGSNDEIQALLGAELCQVVADPARCDCHQASLAIADLPVLGLPR